MEASRSTWTDPRLDDLKDSVAVIDEKVTRLDKKVDQGFARLDGKIDEGLGRLDGRIDEGLARVDGRIDGTNSRIDETNNRLHEMNGRFDETSGRIDEMGGRIDGRIDAMNHTMFQGMIALISIIAVLLTAFLTIVVTQL